VSCYLNRLKTLNKIISIILFLSFIILNSILYMDYLISNLLSPYWVHVVLIF
jgi:hypothetical protein